MAGGVKAIINLARMLLNSERCLSDIKKGCLSDIKKGCLSDIKKGCLSDIK
jgi:hypothetical protein